MLEILTGESKNIIKIKIQYKIIKKNGYIRTYQEVSL